MKSVLFLVASLSLQLLDRTTTAFQVGPRQQGHPTTTTRLFSSTSTTSTSNEANSAMVEFAKQDLIATAERLKRQYGVFLIDKTAKAELKKAVEDLENCSKAPTVLDDKCMEQYLGDWTLVATTATSNEGVDTSKLPFWNQGPLKEIRDSIQKAANKYIRVVQRVRSTDDSGVIDRIDNIIESNPPKELQDVLDNLPEQLSTLSINPLHVSKSQLVLAHKAVVSSSSGTGSGGAGLKTKLTLSSVILNVAGNSQILDPDGKDIAGINIPSLGDFMNNGEFETTYLDKDLRISRGKQGFVDQLRVFVRSDRFARDQAKQEMREQGTSVGGMGVDAEMDVDEVVDPDFVESEDDNVVGGSDGEDLMPSD